MHAGSTSTLSMDHFQIYNLCFLLQRQDQKLYFNWSILVISHVHAMAVHLAHILLYNCLEKSWTCFLLFAEQKSPPLSVLSSNLTTCLKTGRFAIF